MATHELKTWTESFDAQKRGEKTAEFRRDDRTPRFAVGDTLIQHRWDPDGGCCTGEILLRRVTHIARDPRFGIPDGFCMMSLTEMPYDNPKWFQKPDVT